MDTTTCAIPGNPGGTISMQMSSKSGRWFGASPSTNKKSLESINWATANRAMEKKNKTK